MVNDSPANGLPDDDNSDDIKASFFLLNRPRVTKQVSMYYKVGFLNNLY